MKSLLGLLVLAGALGLSGCQRGIEQKVEARSSRVASTLIEVEAQMKERHYCAGITKKGVRCRRPVKVEGDYCWMHKDQDKRKK